MSFRNPVYPSSFPDPFVLKYKDEYWGYSTGFQPDGRVFGIIRSKDLIQWDFSGGAMEPLPGGFTCYWAPEVTIETDGSFLMYYSVGNEENMVIRVARAKHPAGPFVDQGVALTREPFAIDAHVFIDDDGARYLFYATDFLDHSHVGTGTVVDRMLSPTELAGTPTPVTRAKYDWQVYDPMRASKGNVRWHTVEGPFVVKRKGLYYEMFSGGNWQNLTYGVSFATSEQVIRESEWDQHADGTQQLLILRTIPEKVVGPGHNSVVLGPDNRQYYCVYHLWHNNDRVLAIDKLDWRGSEMIVLGPTTTEQPGPNRARSLTFTTTIPHRLPLTYPSALVEMWVRIPEANALTIAAVSSEGTASVVLDAARNVIANAWTRVRIELDGARGSLLIGHERQELTLSGPVTELQITSPDDKAEFEAVEVTYGFEERFERDKGSLNAKSWIIEGTCSVYTGTCVMGEGASRLSKSVSGLEAFELVVNAELRKDAARLTIALTSSEGECNVTLWQEEKELRITVAQSRGPSSERTFKDFSASGFHQLRCSSDGSTLSVQVDTSDIHSMPCSLRSEQCSISAVGTVALDMIRVTELVH